MIYEKKGYLTNSIQKENKIVFPSPAKSSIIIYNKEDTVPYAHPTVHYGKLRKSVKRQRRRKRRNGFLPKFTVMLVTIMFCFYVTDAKFFDGAVTNKFLDTVQNKMFYIINQRGSVSEKESSKTPLSLQSEKIFSEPLEKETPPFPSVEQQETYDVTSKEEQPVNGTKAQSSEGDTSVAVSSLDDGVADVDEQVYYPITELDLSAESVAVLSNNTSYKPDMSIYLEKQPLALENINIKDDEPVVLIVHTHASECYTQHSQRYPQGENTRSEDTDKNVVRVGKEIADILETYSVPVLHLKTLCDKESFINAYNVSNQLVTSALEQYPSIRIVIDVHRDAIIRDSGESIKPTVTVAGQDYAQLMFVVGTDEAGYNHPNWRENLAFATAIQQSADKRYPGLFRPINLRPVPFNQWLSTGYILLEVGSNSNTLDEALLSAQAFGHTLGAMIKEA